MQKNAHEPGRIGDEMQSARQRALGAAGWRGLLVIGRWPAGNWRFAEYPRNEIVTKHKIN